MKTKEISNYNDCATVVMYGTRKEFSQWLEENDVELDLRDKVSTSGYITREGLYLHCVWILNAPNIPAVAAIASLGREASLVADSIDRNICAGENGSLRDRMPSLLRARVIEKIVRVGSELILDGKKGKRTNKPIKNQQ